MALPAGKLERKYTLEEFLEMPEYNERYELIDGRLVKKPVPKFEHSEISHFLIIEYFKFDPDEKLGVLRQEVSVKLEGGEFNPLPALSFWTASRRPDRKAPIAPRPDLAIEIQSKDQSLRKLEANIYRYLKDGVRLVWLIQPEKKVVRVYHPDQAKPLIIAQGQLDGEEIIPGFKLDLDKLFGQI